MIYLISGLGADERVFSRLNFGAHQTTFLPWIVPENNEPMESYLQRFSEKINRDDEIILIGVSFGGIVTVELSKMLNVKKSIIISSIKTVREFSLLLRTLRALSLHKLVPSSRLKNNFNPVNHYFFGGKTREEKKALDDLIVDSDDRIIDWSVNAVMSWENKTVPENLFHIHGTDDKIFPYQYISNAIPVKNATHFMIANRADEVSRIILDILSKN